MAASLIEGTKAHKYNQIEFWELNFPNEELNCPMLSGGFYCRFHIGNKKNICLDILIHLTPSIHTEQCIGNSPKGNFPILVITKIAIPETRKEQKRRLMDHVKERAREWEEVESGRKGSSRSSVALLLALSPWPC